MTTFSEAAKQKTQKKQQDNNSMQILPMPGQDVPPPVVMQNGKLPPIPNQPVLPTEDIWKNARKYLRA